MNEFLQKLFPALLAATLLALLALRKKALTRGGLMLAWLLAVVIGLCGGMGAFAALAATFLCTIIAGKLSGKTGADIGRALHAKTGRRDAQQIMCNVFVGALMLLFLALTNRRIFLWAYGGAMAASLSDSMASELGVLSRRTPRDICTLRFVEKGLSGGVTALGLGASLLGGAIIGGICALAWDGWGMFLSIAAAGFFAAVCDSVLGSRFQAKYRCARCGALTEKPLHCDTPATLERGARFVTNDAVNFINNVIGALAAAGLYCLHF